MLHAALWVAVEHIAHHRLLRCDDDDMLEVASKQVARAQFLGMCKDRELMYPEGSDSESNSDSYQFVGAELGGA